MFNLFILMYQEQVKNIGNISASSAEKKMFAGMIGSSLIILIGYFSNIVYLTLAGSLMMLMLLTVFSIIEKKTTKSTNSLLMLKKERLDSLEKIIVELSLWNEQGISWLNKKCKEASKEHKANSNYIRKIFVSDTIIGLFLSFVQEILNACNIFLQNEEIAQWIRNTSNLKLIIFFCAFPIIILSLVRAWQWYNRIDFMTIQDELSYLKLTRLKQDMPRIIVSK